MMTDAPLLLRTLSLEETERRPVWLMRQAGRYMAEYRARRAKVGGFLAMVKNPEIACEITLQPVNCFAPDAAIIFSDILTIPDAMGLGLYFSEGPRFKSPLREEKAIAGIKPVAAEELSYVFEACRLVNEVLAKDIPLIGFCGSPFTLACYMVDGEGGYFWQTRRMRHERPLLLHQILKANTESAITLLQGQINAGCRVAMIFDSWGGLLGEDFYEEFSLQYIRQIVAAVKPTPTIVYSRQCGLLLADIAACGCDAVGVDWQISLPQAKRVVAAKVALQGNMDPAALLGNTTQTVQATQRVLDSYGEGPGYIFNLGQGVDKRTPPENVAALIETVKAHSLATPSAIGQ